MEESTYSLIMSGVALAIAIIALLLSRNSGAAKVTATDISVKPLQLQAYERLVILAERIALPSLISRVNQPNLTAREMQVILLENIKQEFEYNASQQIYVSPAAWDAVRNLRDQNMLIINSLSSALPADARAHDLNKRLLEAIMDQENTALHTFVLNTLNSEAKKIM
ncbi:MAG TPA: hypothetical protein VGB46_00705 [Flavisolibacter sp.]